MSAGGLGRPLGRRPFLRDLTPASSPRFVAAVALFSASMPPLMATAIARKRCSRARSAWLSGLAGALRLPSFTDAGGRELGLAGTLPPLRRTTGAPPEDPTEAMPRAVGEHGELSDDQRVLAIARSA